MDPLARLDRLPVSRPHLVILVLCGFGLTFDAMDTVVLAFSLPSVREEWGLSQGLTGLIGSAGQLGVMIGAILSGVLSDRLGRRNALMYWLIFYCFFTVVAALSPNYEMFLFARLLAGIGIGADAAILVTYMSEFFPRRRRGLLVGIGVSFFALGSIFAAVLGRTVIASYDDGWRYAQLLSAVPVLLVMLWRPLLRESPRYLLHAGRAEEADRVVTEMERAVERATGAPLPPVPERAEAATAAEQAADRSAEDAADGRAGTDTRRELRLLLMGDMAKRTTTVLVLWIVFQAVSSGFNTWIPTLLIDRGLTIQTSFSYSILIYAAQLPGYLTAAWLGERADRKFAIATTLTGSAVAALVMALATNEVVLVIGGMGLAFFIQGVTAAVYTYTPEQYPTRVRATATGLASGAGRIGSISAPLLIGVAVGSVGFFGIFATMTALLAVAIVVTLAWGPRTAGRGLEDIASEGMTARDRTTRPG